MKRESWATEVGKFYVVIWENGLVGIFLPTNMAATLINLVQGHVVWSYRSYRNLGEIDQNYRSHVFDDVICKPPIGFSAVIQKATLVS